MIFYGRFKTIILSALPGYEIIMANAARRPIFSASTFGIKIIVDYRG